MHPENTSRELQKEVYTSLTRTTLNMCLSKQISWPHSPIFLSANQWWKTGNPCAVGPAKDPAGSELCSVSLTIDSTALPDSHAGTVCQECPTWEAFLWTPPKSLCCMAVCSIILLRLPETLVPQVLRRTRVKSIGQGDWFLRLHMHWSYYSSRQGDIESIYAQLEWESTNRWPASTHSVYSVCPPGEHLTPKSRGPFVVEKYMVNGYSLLPCLVSSWLV